MITFKAKKVLKNLPDIDTTACPKVKEEKADSVYPGYGVDPKDTEDPEDTMGIQRIRRGSRGYHGNPEDTTGIQRIPVGQL